MRKPRPQDFDPDYQQSQAVQPDEIDISGTVPIKSHSKVKQAIKPDRSENRTEEERKSVRRIVRKFFRPSFQSKDARNAIVLSFMMTKSRRSASSKFKPRCGVRP
ncbi:MAG: hypothetical protein PWQ55_1473 [Chloroflexota bacterium]|nr:hypothetical protein [Chloroflexota bacterium]